jgi:hypothetical protein
MRITRTIRNIDRLLGQLECLASPRGRKHSDWCRGGCVSRRVWANIEKWTRGLGLDMLWQESQR